MGKVMIYLNNIQPEGPYFIGDVSTEEFPDRLSTSSAVSAQSPRQSPPQRKSLPPQFNV